MSKNGEGRLPFVGTAIIAGVWLVLAMLLNLVRGPLEAQISAHQLEDSNSSYVWAQFVAGGGLHQLIGIVAVIIIAILWLRAVANRNPNNSNS